MKDSRDHSRLFSGSAIYLGSNILNAALPFLLLPIMTRYMSPKEYGQVAMFQATAAALSAFVGLNAVGAANRKRYDSGVSDEAMGHYIGTCIQILAASTAAILLLAMPFRDQLSRWLELESRWILWAVAVSAATFLINVRLGQWQVRGEAFKYGALQITQGAINVILSLLLVVPLLQGASGRISAQTWSTLAFSAVALHLLFKDRLLLFSWRPAYWREALLFGVPLIPHVAGLFLLRTADRFVVNDSLGTAAAGIYTVAAQLSLILAIVFDAINKAYVPWLFERLDNAGTEAKRTMVRWTYAYFVGAMAAAALALLIGPWLVVVVAGRQYAAAGNLVGWLAVGQAFSGMYLIMTAYVFYSKRTGLLSAVTIGTGLLNLVLLWVLTERLGLSGTAYAFALSMAIRFVLVWIVAQRQYQMPWLLRSSKPV